MPKENNAPHQSPSQGEGQGQSLRRLGQAGDPLNPGKLSPKQWAMGSLRVFERLGPLASELLG